MREGICVSSQSVPGLATQRMDTPNVDLCAIPLETGVTMQRSLAGTRELELGGRSLGRAVPLGDTIQFHHPLLREVYAPESPVGEVGDGGRLR